MKIWWKKIYKWYSNKCYGIFPPPPKKKFTPKTLRLGMQNLPQRVSSNYHILPNFNLIYQPKTSKFFKNRKQLLGCNNLLWVSPHQDDSSHQHYEWVWRRGLLYQVICQSGEALGNLIISSIILKERLRECTRDLKSEFCIVYNNSMLSFKQWRIKSSDKCAPSYINQPQLN